MSYEALEKYILAKKKGGHGWGSKYEESVLREYEGADPNPAKNWAYLAGHYSLLLNNALDWIPPALIKEILNRDN